MSNLLDYIAWRGDLSFAASPFNEVDNLLFSMLSFVDLAGIVPAEVFPGPVKLGEASRTFFDIHPEGTDFGVLIPAVTNTLFRQAAACRRYREVYVTCFRSELDESLGETVCGGDLSSAGQQPVSCLPGYGRYTGGLA